MTKEHPKTFVEKWKKIHESGDYYGRLLNRSDRTKTETQIREAISTLPTDELCSVFEIGCGACTNLDIAGRIMPSATLAGNDLFRDKTMASAGEIAKRIDFYEMTTEQLVLTDIPKGVDVFMSIDHMMHLSPDTVGAVIDALTVRWKPKFIILREASSNTDDRRSESMMPRLAHNYDLSQGFTTISDNDSSVQSGAKFFLRVLKRRD